MLGKSLVICLVSNKKKQKPTSPAPMIFQGEQTYCSFSTVRLIIISPLLVLQVMQVVREQIMRALTVKPNSLDQFKSRLQNLSYTEILKIRQSERMNQEDFQSRPILWVPSRCPTHYIHSTSSISGASKGLFLMRDGVLAGPPSSHMFQEYVCLHSFSTKRYTVCTCDSHWC